MTIVPQALPERWLPVVEYEGLYEVSDQGRIRGVDRYIGHPKGGVRLWRGRMLKQTVMSNGYFEVSLCKEGARTVRTVHSVVCEAFHGPAPTGYWAAHENGQKFDCRAQNLSWKTVADNQADKKRHGTQVCGEAHYAAKLTEKAVHRARALYTAGYTQKRIAGLLGVTRRTIGRAVSGQAWAHV